MKSRMFALMLVLLIGLVGCSDDDDPVVPASTGTIVIDLQPEGIEAPWQLAAPNYLTHSGTGEAVIVNMPLGNYAVTWGEVAGHVTPVSEPQTLVAGGTITFTGTYEAVGTISINQNPAGLVGAGWSLTGPSEEDGSGNEMFTGMPTGEYTLTWNEVEGYITPVSEPQTLSVGGTITFSGTYVATTGTVLVSPQPAGIDTPWEIAGPDGYSADGSGQSELTSRVPGNYTITWGEVTDYIPPVNEPQTLVAGGTITFTGIYTLDYVNNFVYIAPATFTMGSPDDEPGRYSNEWPQHQVTLTQGFYMSKYEVTEQWWAEVMGGAPTTSRFPKSRMNWDLAVQFCNALSAQEDLTPAYEIHGPDGDVTWHQDANGYRLPTEAEWEYACRATTTMAYHNNTNCLHSTTEANYQGNSDQLPGCPWGLGRGSSTVVGSFPANQWGLYDMHGNVAEWVWCGQRTYTYDSRVNPVHNVEPGANRVLRGGRFNQEARYCRSAYRGYVNPDYSHWNSGFRPVRSAF